MIHHHIVSILSALFTLSPYPGRCRKIRPRVPFHMALHIGYNCRIVNHDLLPKTVFPESQPLFSDISRRRNAESPAINCGSKLLQSGTSKLRERTLACVKVLTFQIEPFFPSIVVLDDSLFTITVVLKAASSAVFFL